jgi:hypothetical protein
VVAAVVGDECVSSKSEAGLASVLDLVMLSCCCC